jgi:heat-inducible transcriptional repressor
VLLLQPQIAMVVVITATGAVAKRTVVFERSVDPGLAEFAREYLNETVTGVALGTVALRRHLEAPDLSARERDFLAAIAPVFSEVIADGDRLYVGGAGRLMSELRSHDSQELTRLADVLEERAALLHLLSEVLGTASVSVRIGGEHRDPVLRPLAVIAASYGLARRQLGTVSLVGPTRMDYPAAVAAVRGAAVALSAFVEDVYES